MAKLQHTFVQGKMNKDLDERLVPNGQYRDAQNIQISSSESSDVGAVENILGNTKKNNKPGGGTWETTGSGTTPFGLANPKCIGVARDNQNEKIYWFITSDSVDAILEYDQTTSIVSPVLVDTGSILNFSASHLITGVNILEGMLFWTDNNSEPKKINIARFKAGSIQPGVRLDTKTQVYGRDFKESDITVILKSPNIAVTTNAVPSLVGGNATGITPVTTTQINFNGGPPLFNPLAVGTVVNISALSAPILFDAPPTVSLKTIVTNDDNTQDTYEIIGVLSNIAANGLSCDITISSISSSIPNIFLEWEMLLVESEPIFKNDFPRFSYRWQYIDNEYSTYAPFSEAVFVAGKFEYLSSDGYNSGMNNTTRKITLSAFQSPPANVIAVDILYKGVSSNNVYVVETIDLTSSSLTDFVITTELLGKIIESVQLLRPWDNVPRKAKSQEIISNRIVYGNYLQNYSANRAISLNVNQSNNAHTNVGFGLKSIKSDRTYQIGITFIDQFNRESPVFTNKLAASEVAISSSSKTSYFTAQLNSTAPSFATAYKYYIKEPSAEYYNLALDRVYDAKDGNIWLSFPSSERNKIKDNSYLILKKQHNTDVPVTRDNRYKVLDIVSEAPDYIKKIPKVVARVTIEATAGSFTVGSNAINFHGPTAVNNEAFHSLFNNNASIQFIDGPLSSKIYNITGGGPTGVHFSSHDHDVYSALLSTVISSDDSWLDNYTTDTDITAVLYNSEDNNLPEFQGRFYTKINKNSVFTENVLVPLGGIGPNQVIVDTIKTPAAIANTGYSTGDTTVGAGWTDPNSPTYVATPSLLKAPVASDANFILGFVTLSTPEGAALSNTIAKLDVGTQIRFVGPSNQVGLVYTIINISSSFYSRQLSNPTYSTNTRDITLNVPWTDGFASVEGIQIVEDIPTLGNTRLTSTNPAIFETEPLGQTGLDVYYEASNAIDISNAGNIDDLDWWNCYSFGNGVESDRIRDDFNSPRIGNGVRVSSTLETPYEEERREAGMIFSGIFNSTSGINNTNQFIIAENITKDLNPVYGSIQKLYARDTDLIALCEDKCFKILADKNALFNADGNTNITSSNNVLGQTIPYIGEFGISKNPESFASYGFRTYFTDKSRGTVIRLSRDGITEIADKGMSNYFEENLKQSGVSIIGSYDEANGSYNLKIGPEQTSFKERVDGWSTRLSYAPEFAVSLNNEYYSFKNGEIWEHSNSIRSNFYGVQKETTVTPVFNDAPSSIKNFKTLSYEGDEGWTAAVTTNEQGGAISTWKKREGKFFNYIIANATTLATIDTKAFSVQGLGDLYDDPVFGGGGYNLELIGEINVSLQVGDIIYSDAPALRVLGGVTAINRTTNVVSISTSGPLSPAPQQYDFILFAKDSSVNTSGLLGYYADVKFSTNSGEKKELFAVNSEIFISSE